MLVYHQKKKRDSSPDITSRGEGGGYRRKIRNKMTRVFLDCQEKKKEVVVCTLVIITSSLSEGQRHKSFNYVWKNKDFLEHFHFFLKPLRLLKRSSFGQKQHTRWTSSTSLQESFLLFWQMSDGRRRLWTKPHFWSCPTFFRFLLERPPEGSDITYVVSHSSRLSSCWGQVLPMLRQIIKQRHKN